MRVIYRNKDIENSKNLKGFITIATGSNKYYQMAQNLVKSYKKNGNCSLPFAIICDKECMEVQEFDCIVIIDKPNNSYLDKLYLHEYSPFYETVFIDADSLILGPVSCIFDDYAPMGDFSCYGKLVPLNSSKGWFNYDGMGELKDKISFSISMHGGIYYLRKTEICTKVFTDAQFFAKNYHLYSFAEFTNPADEPVLALSMALADSKPCDRKGRILFYPSVEGDLFVNSNGKLMLFNEECNVPVLHFGNRNVERYIYKRVMEIYVDNKCEKVNFSKFLRYFWLEIKFFCIRKVKAVLPKNIIMLIRKILKH